MEVLHRQMEQYKDQPQHAEKISYQQRLLQEDLIHIRAEISKVSTVHVSSCFKNAIIKTPVRIKLYWSLDRGVKSYSELIWLRYRILNQKKKIKRSLQFSFLMPLPIPHSPQSSKNFFILFSLYMGLKLQIFHLVL